MENLQGQIQDTTEKTDLSKYNLEALKAQQELSNRKVDHQIVPISKALKNYLNKPKQKTSKLVSKEIIRDLFVYFSSNFYGKGKHYLIDDDNKSYVFELLSYFSRSEKFGSQGIVRNTPSLDKGLLIFGPCGVGKSDLFEILKRMGSFLANHGYMQMYFKGYTAKDIVINKVEFSKKPNERNPLIKNISIDTGNIYLDDVGTESKFFSQEVIGEWIQQRYIASKSKPYRSYITSNMTPSELSARYGMQVEDRLREMFNIIKWEGASRR